MEGGLLGLSSNGIDLDKLEFDFTFSLLRALESEVMW